MLPLYEAKMIHHYDTRWATYERDGSTRYLTADEKRDPDFHVVPRYWVAEAEVDKKFAGKWDKSWFLGWRDIARATDERTLISTKLPRLAVGNKIPLIMPSVTNDSASSLQAALSSYVLDFATRQKAGGTTLNFFIIEQLPTPAPAALAPYRVEIAEKVDCLNAQRLEADSSGRLRAELDGLMFYVYGVDREDVDYIMETFPIVREKDVAVHGTYRTKDLILAAYDRLVGI